MKALSVLFLLFRLLSINSTYSHSQVTDYTPRVLTEVTQKVISPETAEESDVYTAARGVVVLVLSGFLLFCIGAGVVLTGLMCSIVLGLVLAGILSTSLIVSARKKSIAAGAKTFWLLTGSMFGLVAGGVSYWALVQITHWTIPTGMTLALGGASGGAAGLITAWFSWWAGHRLLNYLSAKLAI
ncbi:MAG TPA: hypothetical protein VF598_13700 [Hymenobacter sp.]|jgi:hypothetical protein